MTVIHTIWESIPYQFFFESDDVFHSFVCLLIYYQGRVGHVSFFLNEPDRRAVNYIKKKKQHLDWTKQQRQRACIIGSPVVLFQLSFIFPTFIHPTENHKLGFVFDSCPCLFQNINNTPNKHACIPDQQLSGNLRFSKQRMRI